MFHDVKIFDFIYWHSILDWYGQSCHEGWNDEDYWLCLAHYDYAHWCTRMEREERLRRRREWYHARRNREQLRRARVMAERTACKTLARHDVYRAGNTLQTTTPWTIADEEDNSMCSYRIPCDHDLPIIPCSAKLWWIWQDECHSPIFYPAKFQITKVAHVSNFKFANIFLTKTLKRLICQSFTLP